MGYWRREVEISRAICAISGQSPSNCESRPWHNRGFFAFYPLIFFDGGSLSNASAAFLAIFSVRIPGFGTITVPFFSTHSTHSAHLVVFPPLPILAPCLRRRAPDTEKHAGQTLLTIRYLGTLSRGRTSRWYAHMTGSTRNMGQKVIGNKELSNTPELQSSLLPMSLWGSSHFVSSGACFDKRYSVGHNRFNRDPCAGRGRSIGDLRVFFEMQFLNCIWLVSSTYKYFGEPRNFELAAIGELDFGF